MAVHGRYREPCPVCGAPVQRLVYAENEANYCARCQTGGTVLADRSLSKLLKDDWPRTLEDWEGCESLPDAASRADQAAHTRVHETRRPLTPLRARAVWTDRP